MAAHASDRRVVYAALIGNLLIAVTKFIAAAWTGSSAMLSEGVHSAVDTGNELLLLYGLKRASAPPDRAHPLGYGRELYFWSFIVALLVFALGAGISLYEGVMHILDPEPIEDPTVNFVVLGLSALFEGYSWSVALKAFRAAKGDLGYLQAVRQSKDPTTFTVLFEDSAALIGLGIAAAGIGLSLWLERPEFDGAASIGIGLVLAATATLLARECKGLLLGEPVLPEVRDDLLRLVREDPGLAAANGLITVHIGPAQVVAALSAEFEDRLTAPEIEATVRRIENRIRAAHPEVTMLFVKPQSVGTYAQRIRALDEGRSG